MDNPIGFILVAFFIILIIFIREGIDKKKEIKDLENQITRTEIIASYLNDAVFYYRTDSLAAKAMIEFCFEIDSAITKQHIRHIDAFDELNSMYNLKIQN